MDKKVRPVITKTIRLDTVIDNTGYSNVLYNVSVTNTFLRNFIETFTSDNHKYKRLPKFIIDPLLSNDVIQH